jgi:hypothetical protein
MQYNFENLKEVEITDQSIVKFLKVCKGKKYKIR